VRIRESPVARLVYHEATVPPKPRSQSPRPRTDKGGGLGSGGIDRRILGAVATAIVAAVAIVLALVLSGGGGAGGKGGGSEAEARAALSAAGCTLKIVPALKGADHSITDPDGSSPKWNTDPPTSGPHYAQTLYYGSYTEPVQQARALHNLEHGAVNVQYGSKVPKETVAQIQTFYDTHKNGTIVAPLPRMGDKIVLTAWNAPNPSDPGRGILATCRRFDDKAFSSFFATFQFKGPERFPASTMVPGSG
jgi:hypothetical protein